MGGDSLSLAAVISRRLSAVLSANVTYEK